MFITHWGSWLAKTKQSIKQEENVYNQLLNNGRPIWE